MSSLPDNLWELSDEIKVIRPAPEGFNKMEEVPFPAGPFCAKDYAEFYRIRPRTARERIQHLLEQGKIRLHLWLKTSHGHVPYYVSK